MHFEVHMQFLQAIFAVSAMLRMIFTAAADSRSCSPFITLLNAHA